MILQELKKPPTKMVVAYDLYDYRSLKGFKKVQLIDWIENKIIAQVFVANKFFDKDYNTLNRAIRSAFFKYNLNSWTHINYTL